MDCKDNAKCTNDKNYNDFILPQQPLIGYVNMWKLFVVTLIIVALAVALLCVKLILRRNGRFTSMHIHDSQAMKDRGIHCVIEQDREARQEKTKNKQNNNQ